jgi:outer membrane usher protein
MSALNDLLLGSRGLAARRGFAPALPHELDAIMAAAMIIDQAAVLAPPPTAVATATPALVRINPTKRVLRFIVPLTDGPTYLGDVELAVSPEDRLSVAAPRLLQMLELVLKPVVFARLKAAVGTSPVVAAEQLAAEKIVLRYDSQKLSLAIDIPVAARRLNSLSLRGARESSSETLAPAAVSGYLNLRSAVDLVERGPDRGLVPPVSLLDGAVRAFGVVTESEGYVSLRSGEPLIRRTGSRLVYDDLAHTVRWTLGDVRSYGRNFQSTPAAAGLSVARFYNVLDPQREVRPTGSQGFTLFAPSTVETVVNGRVVERKLLQPGSYTLQDFPLAEGGNDVRLDIEDQTGKRRTVEFNVYSNQQLLEPGASEFAAFGGVYAQPTRRGIAYSRRWTASGFVRRGISQQLTLGVNGQGDGDSQQVGSEILFGSGLGLIGLDLAASRRTAGPNGFAGAARFEKIIGGSTTRSQSLRALVEVRSASFAVPGALTAREPIAVRASAGFAVTLGRDSFVALDGQYVRDRVQQRSQYGARASGGFRLSQELALVAEAEWNRTREQHGALFRLGLRKRFGIRGTGQIDADSRGVVRGSYQNSGGQGVGAWTGSFDVNRDSGGTTVNAAGSLITNRLDLGLSQLATYDGIGTRISNVRTSLRAGASLAFADGAFAIGRPVQDGFLIAAPHRSLAGKSVRLDPREKSDEAHSDRFGAGLLGSLSAYSPRLLVYAVPDAPPGYDLGQGNVQLVPPYRGGYRLEVGSDYHLLVLGRLLDARGDPVSLLAGRAIDLKAPKRPVLTMFTSRDGKFGAQGLRPGRWRIEMPTEPPTIYEINVGDSPSGTVRLGDIRPVQQGRGVQ